MRMITPGGDVGTRSRYCGGFRLVVALFEDTGLVLHPHSIGMRPVQGQPRALAARHGTRPRRRLYHKRRMTNAHAFVESPVGTLTLIATSRGLAAILWEDDRPGRVPLDPGAHDPARPMLAEAARQLGEYFARERTAFDLPLDPQGTDFQRDVWRALEAIPFGETRSYAQIARMVGRPTAFRAVGAANGRNPLSIVVPCHRVIGTGGALTGFAGGLEGKQFLLALERKDDQLALSI